MGKFKEKLTKVEKAVDKKSPAILLTLAIGGFVTATVLAIKATPKATKIVKDAERELNANRDELNDAIQHNAKESDIKEIKKARRTLYLKTAKELGIAYGPTAVLTVTSTLCAVKSHNIEHGRLTAMATAYQISETARREYKNKVVEMIGAKKEKDIRDEIAKDKVGSNPPDVNSDVYNSQQDTLCYDALTGRYFRSNAMKLGQICNKLNKNLLNYMYVSLNEFYDMLDDPNMGPVKLGDELGWNVDDGDIELCLTSMLTDNDVPCLVVDYLVAPRYDFRNLH